MPQAGIFIPAFISYVALWLNQLPTATLSTCNTYAQAIAKDTCSGTIHATEGNAYIQLQSTRLSRLKCNKTIEAFNLTGLDLPPFQLQLPCHNLQKDFLSPLNVVETEVGFIYSTIYYYALGAMTLGAIWGVFSPLGNQPSGVSGIINTLYFATYMSLSLQAPFIIASYIGLLLKNIPYASIIAGQETNGTTFLPQYLQSLMHIISTPKDEFIKGNTTHHPAILQNSKDILNRCHTASTSEGLVNILTQSMTQLFTWTDMIYVLTGLLAFLPPIIALLSYTTQSSNTDTQYTPLHTDPNSITFENNEGSKHPTPEGRSREKHRKNTHYIRVTTTEHHAERKSYTPPNSNPLPVRNTSSDSNASDNEQSGRLSTSV